MSAAYIPFGTSIMPPCFRGEVIMDGLMIDLLAHTGRTMFSARNKTLWPKIDNGPGNIKRDGLKLLVTPHSWSIDPEGLHVVQVDFRKVRDFWATWDTQQRGF